jgi:hypothetical protein
MNTHMSDITDLLPNSAPACANRRLLLYGFRRMASAGLNDAHAAHAMLAAFGRSYRRPLILMRAFAAELSRVSNRRLMVAPCCCPRMTAAETVLIDAAALSRDDPHRAHTALAALLGVHQCVGALGSAQAVAQAFEDLGRPLGE